MQSKYFNQRILFSILLMAYALWFGIFTWTSRDRMMPFELAWCVANEVSLLLLVICVLIINKYDFLQKWHTERALTLQHPGEIEQHEAHQNDAFQAKLLTQRLATIMFLLATLSQLLWFLVPLLRDR